MTVQLETREALEAQLAEMVREHGEWTFDIPLPHGVWTRGNRGVPHTRLLRLLQMAADVSRRPLSECRVLDLGCLDGMFSIEFALQGATVLGVEVREANYAKAVFAKEALGLEKLHFELGDVRAVSRERHGEFDVILCSGILYHLPAPDVFRLIETMYAMATDALIVDTRISLKASESVVHGAHTYWGETYREHHSSESREQRLKKLWASADNEVSFWLSRPSLVNCLGDAGFSSVYECFLPLHDTFGRAGAEGENRCTLVALKRDRAQCHTSPTASSDERRWPEGRLAYAPPRRGWRAAAQVLASIPGRVLRPGTSS